MKYLRMTEELWQTIVEKRMLEAKDMPVLPTSLTVQINPSVKLTDKEKVEVVFRSSAYKKMLALINECPKEIGWHGFVEKINNRRYEITDIVVFPQVVTGATVTPDEVEYTNWMINLATEQEENYNKMRFHGHSHVNMATTPSGVDTEYQKTLSRNIPDFYIFGIFNKSGSWWLNILDIENNILFEKEDIEYKYIPDPEEEWATDMIKEYVKESSKAPTGVTSYTGGTADQEKFTIVNGKKVYKFWRKGLVWDNALNGYVESVPSNSGVEVEDEEDWSNYENWRARNRRYKGYGGVNYD